MDKMTRSSITTAAGLGIILLLLIGVKFGFHEAWKDEWQAWFLSRDLGVFDLLKFLYYEGHPALFYLYLKPFAGLLPSGDIGLKVAHILPVLLMYFLLWRSQIPAWAKLILAFSYPLFFEYGIVSRGYILTIVFAWWMTQNQDSKWMPLVIFLICQTEVHGVLFAMAFLGTQWWVDPNKKINIPNLGALALGFLIFVLTVFPREDRSELSFAYSADWTDIESWIISFQGTLANVFGIGLIRDTNVFGWSAWGLLLSAIIAFGAFQFLRKDKSALLLSASYWGMSFLFHALIYNGGVRQWAMIFVVWAVSLEWTTPELWSGQKKWIFVALCLGPIFYNTIAIQKDITMPFTNAKMAGEFIQEKVPDEVPVIAINKFECTPVVGYADRPVYSLPDGEAFTYFRWVERIYIPTSAELDLFAKFKKVGGLVILSPGRLDPERFPKLEEWEVFDDHNLKGEKYILYTQKVNSSN